MYEWRSHTAEIELALAAGSEEEIFAEALEAFGRLIELADDGSAARHEIELVAHDRGALLVEWIDELIYLADTESFVPDRVEALELRPNGLRARLAGRSTHFDPLVKAATWHDLRFERSDGGWEARIVLDV